MKSSEVKIFSCILVIAVVLVGFAVAPAIMQTMWEKRRHEPKETNLTRELLVPAGSHMRGDPGARTTIVVFSDFQCPSCSSGAPVLKKILEDKKGEVNEVFHHFQVKPEHTYAPILSLAAEAADEQGKFWEMHDRIFANQKDLVASSSEAQLTSQLRNHAKELGIDLMKFDIAMKKTVGLGEFRNDNKLGIKVDVPSTPVYFVIDPSGKVTRFDSTPALLTWAQGGGKKKA